MALDCVINDRGDFMLWSANQYPPSTELVYRKFNLFFFFECVRCGIFSCLIDRYGDWNRDNLEHRCRWGAEIVEKYELKFLSFVICSRCSACIITLTRVNCDHGGDKKIPNAIFWPSRVESRIEWIMQRWTIELKLKFFKIISLSFSFVLYQFRSWRIHNN